MRGRGLDRAAGRCPGADSKSMVLNWWWHHRQGPGEHGLQVPHAPPRRRAAVGAGLFPVILEVSVRLSTGVWLRRSLTLNSDGASRPCRVIEVDHVEPHTAVAHPHLD